jgi:DNA-binding HxlR family transcriptional regulator
MGPVGQLDCPCPPAGMIDVVGKKWAMCVVTLLGRNGALRFGPIQKSLPRVSPATLTATLRALERHGLVRRIRGEGGLLPQGGYGLTGPGEALYRSLLPLASWLRESSI